jgi:hypothetical protein
VLVTPSRRRATIRLLLACDNRCVFCAQSGLQADAPDGFADSLERARGLSDELTFVGGEPTLDPALPEKIAMARARGFCRVGLQTNGSRLADSGYTTALARAGLTDVHFSLHGSEARVHDYHTGRPGSFAEIIAAMRAVRASELAFVATTVLTRSNFRVMDDLPGLLAARGAAGWLVSVPVTAGRAATLRDRVVPRLGLALPFALRALTRGLALRLPSWLVGAPLCMLGPLATLALADESRVYAPVCDACPARPSCPGVDSAYLARFGPGELAPRPLPVPASAEQGDATSAIQRMFVGVGERAPVE